MRFLIDAQLPIAVARWLTARGHVAEHVFDLNLAQAKDSEIWNLATRTSAVVVTKDDDFVELARLKPGPRILWITAVNMSKLLLLEKLERRIADIEGALDAGESLVELR